MIKEDLILAKKNSNNVLLQKNSPYTLTFDNLTLMLQYGGAGWSKDRPDRGRDLKISNPSI